MTGWPSERAASVFEEFLVTGSAGYRLRVRPDHGVLPEDAYQVVQPDRAPRLLILH
jgi:hypothetical protein